jgi:membrane-associated phospholipid phosphatase
LTARSSANVESFGASALRGDLIGNSVSGASKPSQPVLGQAPLLTQGAIPRAQSFLLEATGGLRVQVASGAVEVQCLAERDKALSWQPLLRFYRPPPELFQAQVALVDAELPLRETRAGEVLAQSSNAFSFFLGATAVPWNRRPRSLEFIDIALNLMQMLQQRVKQLLACARPHTLQPALMPIIEVPEHGSLPSGHAGESRLVAELIGHWAQLANAQSPVPGMLDRLATRIAHNRVVAGVHFPVDSVAGGLLGQCVFAYLRAAIEQEAAQFGEFGHREASGWGRFELVTPENAAAHAVLTPAGFTPPALPDLAALWALACAEWQ